MFPLAGDSFPKDAQELKDSIHLALEEVLSFAKGSQGVSVDAPQYPRVKKMKVELSGAKVTAKEPPPEPKPTGKRQKGIEVAQLELRGHPIQYQSSKVNFDLKGKDVAFDFARDKKSKPLLVLTDAASGTVDVNVSKADLHSLALTAAGMAAREKGVTIQSLDIALQSKGKRAVEANVQIKAKKLMVSGTIRITASLQVDDDLNAIISNLNCSGEGVVGNMVAGFVQPKLKAYNGKKFALMAFSLGDLALRDLKIDVQHGLHVTAAFGK